MSNKIKSNTNPKKEDMENALDKLIDQAKAENEALKKILVGMNKIHKKELEQKLNNKSKNK